MVSDKLFEYLIGVLEPLSERIYDERYRDYGGAEELRGLGYGDKGGKKITVWRGETLRLVMRELICESEPRYFLSNGSKGVLYVYDGISYRRIDDGVVFLKEFLKRLFKSLGIGLRYVDEYPAKMIAESCIDTLLASDKYLYVPDTRYIAFNNTVYDAQRNVPVTSRPSLRPWIRLDLDYRTKSEAYRCCADKYGILDNPCKLWDEKIRQIIPHRESRRIFQMWCGALMADKREYKKEYVLFLVGPGANGKSLVSEVVASVFGEDYFSRFSLRQLFKDSDRNVNIAALRGKVANFIDDLDVREISGGDFKRFASGGVFQGRVPYDRKPINVVAPPLLCCTNAMPDSDDDTYGGYRRRLVVYTTSKSFTGANRDTTLPYKLTREDVLVYIFHWIMEGYRMFVKHGGDMPMSEDFLRIQEFARAGSNSMRRWWFDSDYEPVKRYDKDNVHLLSELHAEYLLYAKSERSKPFTPKELSAMLEDKGCWKHHSRRGTQFCLRKIEQGHSRPWEDEKPDTDKEEGDEDDNLTNEENGNNDEPKGETDVQV